MPEVERPWVLGVGVGNHDAAASLVRDGGLVVMGEQERFSRNKRAGGEAAVDAIRFCLDHAGIALGDVAAVGVGTDYRIKNQWKGLSREELAEAPVMDHPDRLFPRSIFSYDEPPPIVPIRHHLSHAASAFRVSGFDRAAILVIDNQGEDNSTTLALGENDTIEILETYGVACSLGLYYRTAAQFSGVVGKLKSVGKFMGLASYGRPNQKVPLALSPEGLPVLEGLPELPPLRGLDLPPYRSLQLFEYFSHNCFPFVPQLADEVMAYANFAASVQNSLEDVILGLGRRLRAETGCDRLALAGGVALNCSANGRLAAAGCFEEIFVQPAAHDAGVAIGAALELEHRLLVGREPPRFRMEHALWGPAFSQAAINAVLDRRGLAYRVLDEAELVDQVAELLAAEKVVGWFQGRAEVGPRALGARSLLGDPRTRRTLVRLNRIKSREMWRPLAPSVLAERFADYFSSPHASPFMIVASPVRPERQRLVPAVVHVDGSARPQSVQREIQPRFWALLRAFERRTGVPMVVNTSFNVAREPIVNTPDNAIDDFLKTETDALALGDALVLKS